MPDAALRDTDLLAHLQLETLDADRFRASNPARNLAGPIFGGQLLGSAMAAAMASGVRARPHMLQAFFLRSGNAAQPLDIAVERSKDGRRFAHRRVLIRQAGKDVLSAEASFHDDEPGGPEHEIRTAPAVPPPEALADLDTLAEQHRERISAHRYRRLRGRRSMLVRPCDPHAGLFAKIPAAQLAFWMKPAGPPPATPAERYAALAFMSDHWLVSPSVVPHMDCLVDGPWAMNSLNHSLWFHREVALDDWLLYAVESPILRGRRGLAHGTIYTRDGDRVASAVQECLLTEVPDFSA